MAQRNGNSDETWRPEEPAHRSGRVPGRPPGTRRGAGELGYLDEKCALRAGATAELCARLSVEQLDGDLVTAGARRNVVAGDRERHYLGLDQCPEMVFRRCVPRAGADFARGVARIMLWLPVGVGLLAPCGCSSTDVAAGEVTRRRARVFPSVAAVRETAAMDHVPPEVFGDDYL